MNDDLAYPGLDGMDAVDRAKLSERNLKSARESARGAYISPVEPAPKVAVDARGFYWRVYPEHLSMCPTTTANESPEPFTYYVPADALEQAEASLSSLRAALERIASTGCENFFPGKEYRCITSGRSQEAVSLVNRWCDPCIAHFALALAPQEDGAAPTETKGEA